MYFFSCKYLAIIRKKKTFFLDDTIFSPVTQKRDTIKTVTQSYERKEDNDGEPSSLININIVL